MANDIVRKIDGIKNIEKQEKWTNKTGDILITEDKKVYVNNGSDYVQVDNQTSVSHADTADTATKAETATTADNATKAESLGHTLTIKQDGKEDIVFDGSKDIVLDLTTPTTGE